jgi:hypothetical protein
LGEFFDSKYQRVSMNGTWPKDITAAKVSPEKMLMGSDIVRGRIVDAGGLDLSSRGKRERIAAISVLSGLVS